MKEYIGTKLIKAEPMTLQDAQKVLGRVIKPATIENDGYLVQYKDGYKSWSPKSVFDDAYHELKGMDFGQAINALKSGLAIQRAGWNGKGMFVVKQVPSYIEGDIVPEMQSLPQSAKDIIKKRENPHIKYRNQLLIVNRGGIADSWTASSTDILAEDWEVVLE